MGAPRARAGPRMGPAPFVAVTSLRYREERGPAGPEPEGAKEHGAGSDLVEA